VGRVQVWECLVNVLGESGRPIVDHDGASRPELLLGEYMWAIVQYLDHETCFMS
jgi:hypothetical protein